MRDRETIEIALTAAETGHLVFSTLHTIDASKTVERIIGAFDAGDQQAVRTRLAASFRYFISQRLLPNKAGGRVAVLEILKSTHAHARLHRAGRVAKASRCSTPWATASSTACSTSTARSRSWCAPA